LDVGASDKEYTISVELPGVDEKEIQLELSNNTLKIKGEKKQQKEEKEKNYYRMERSYGSFQRVLSLPEDADQEKINATYKNGIMEIAIPRKASQKTETKKIEIKTN
jgi:HSP20 family protein